VAAAGFADGAGCTLHGAQGRIVLSAAGVLAALLCAPAPRLMSKEEQAQYGVQIGSTYPAPIANSQFGRPHGVLGAGGDPDAALQRSAGVDNGAGRRRNSHKAAAG
jgi:hypothetical protein